MNSSTNKYERKVLDHGLVRLVDTMPNANGESPFETAVVQMARVSYGSGTKSFREDLGLVKYLLENDHTSPFEGVTLKFHIKMPIFVARQWIRHRTASVNEYSARYSVMEDVFYIPEPNRLTTQSTSNKQSSSDIVIDNAEQVSETIAKHSKICYELYEKLLSQGLSRELARMVIPVNVYTEMYWVMNLHNLLKFLRLRMDHHAQYEIRVFADAIFEIVNEIAPNIMEVWKSSQLDSIRFTGEEIEVIKTIISVGCEPVMPDTWSKRRRETFTEKLSVFSQE